MNDKRLFELLDIEGKSPEQMIRQLEELLESNRTELIVYRPELEKKLAELRKSLS